jgi:hypothetical protein
LKEIHRQGALLEPTLDFWPVNRRPLLARLGHTVSLLRMEWISAFRTGLVFAFTCSHRFSAAAKSGEIAMNAKLNKFHGLAQRV